MRSLRTRLIGLWGLSLAACIAVGALLLHLEQQTTAAQVGRAQAVAARSCGLIQDHYDFYAAGWTGIVPPLTDLGLLTDLRAIVTVALANQPGVEGGLWQSYAGSLAYAFPTYQGGGPKTDLPVAERTVIQAVNEQAARDEQPAEQNETTPTQTLLLRACPLDGPISGLTAWTMIRVQAANGLQPLELGLGVLLALMVVMSVWLGRTMVVWGRHVRGIEGALAQAGDGGIPAVARTGERELDQIIDALNEAGARLSEARQDHEVMAARMARAERLAALGRVAAGVAHEIRNPIAAARLQGENALAGPDSRRQAAIGDMLGQIDRLDALAGELLAMTQRVAPAPVDVVLRPFLAEQLAKHETTGEARGLSLTATGPDSRVRIDPAVVGRVLDNLLTNAIRHAPEGGHVRLCAQTPPGALRFTVADDGPGVPDAMRDRLFEPFVTGRADGTGLGLAIARELADAHGGVLELRSGAAGAGAAFTLTLKQDPV